jgi:anti-sigma regulatory factor (Ser/Thr protein kinase)
MHKLTIKNNISNLDNIAGFVEQFCTEHDLTPKTCFEINLVLDELVTNTIHYGYTDDDIHEIEISLEKQDDRVLIKLVDDAKEFNPLEKEEVDTSTSLHEKSVGGLGIHFVKQKADEIYYSREEGKNILSLVKKL